MMVNHPNRDRKPDDYRLKITGRKTGAVEDWTSYIVRKKGVVSYISGKERDLSLSELVGDHAAELRFALEDALHGSRAGVAVREALLKLYPNEINRPKVEILS